MLFSTWAGIGLVCVSCQGGVTINGYRLRPYGSYILGGKADIQKMKTQDIIMNNVKNFEGHFGGL